MKEKTEGDLAELHFTEAQYLLSIDWFRHLSKSYDLIEKSGGSGRDAFFLLRNDGVRHQLGQPHDIDIQFVVLVQLSELVLAVVTGSHDGLGTGGTDLFGFGLSGLQPDLVVVRQGNQAATAAQQMLWRRLGVISRKSLTQARRIRRGSSKRPPFRPKLQES